MAVNTEVRTRKQNSKLTSLLAVILMVFAMGLAMFYFPSLKTDAANLKVVTSCKGLEVRKVAGVWWTYQGNTRVSYTGIAHNENGWWRTVNGQVDWNYTGIACNDNGWYRIVNGKVRFDQTGVYKNEYGWWYCQYGKVDFGYTGMKSNSYGSWRVEGGKVNFNFNGIAPSDDGHWYYFVNGKFDGSFTGLVKNDYGTWYVSKGVIDFTFNGTYRGYTIKENKVIEETKTTTTTKTPSTNQKNLNNNNVITDANGNLVVEDRGIVVDISKWNGNIDFGTMKKSGVKGVMMRAAYASSKDIKFDTYSSQCEVYGIDYGVYQFATFHYNSTKSAAMTKAKTQADALLGFLKGKKIKGYVTLDLELESGYKLEMTAQELTDVANYWCDLIQKAGYMPMIYCSVSWMQNNLVASNIHAPFWLAYYNDTGSYNFPKTGYGQYMDSIDGKITMWQYTDKGNGAKYGAESEYIDLNRLYHSFTGATK
ncbi:MAG: hypothetical protein IJ720_03115 [Clostridia bacterium]|nr:hypothetical protein [Clostridia bacterium]